MPLVAMKDMINHASQNGYALGSFHFFNLESLSAAIAAAETCRAPVILSVDQSWAEAVDIGMLLAAAEHAAHGAGIPVGLHYQCGSDVDSAVVAIRWGCNGLAVDGSQLALPQKIAVAQSVVEMARSCGVPVEGLLGRISSERDGAGVNTTPQVEPTSVDEAKAFVEQTGIDFLALAVASGQDELDMQHIAHIKSAVSVPVGIDDGYSLSDDQIHRLVAQGVAKIHFATHLSVFDASAGSTAEQMRHMRDGIREYVLERMRLLGSDGRAAEVLRECRAWDPVEHVIVFNVDTAADININQVLAQGRRVLSEIPGVRYVYTGEAIQAEAAYRFCWLVRFVHPAVIDSYREHSDHKKFADDLFRPIAPARMSIDFQMTTAGNSVQSNRAPEQADEDTTTSSTGSVVS